jgi:hypothetical protein
MVPDPYVQVVLELASEKKPRAKAPPSEMRVSPGESDFACDRWSSDLQNELKKRRMRTGKQAVAILGPCSASAVEEL